jgi:hypothetical protein
MTNAAKALMKKLIRETDLTTLHDLLIEVPEEKCSRTYAEEAEEEVTAAPELEAVVAELDGTAELVDTPVEEVDVTTDPEAVDAVESIAMVVVEDVLEVIDDPVADEMVEAAALETLADEEEEEEETAAAVITNHFD